MSDDSQDNPIDVLAEDFVARFRLGERPALTEYVTRHPELADEIRELFPALVMLEQARSQSGGREGLTEEFASLANGVQRQLGEYRILREVGRGGMGIVYEAIQESLGRHVALKILPTRVTPDDRHRQRFQREARAAARLHHPHIVPVFGVGEVDGVSFYAMQFIQGLGLDQIASEVKRLRFEKTLPQGQRNPVASKVRAAERPHSLPHDSVASLAAGLVSGIFRTDDQLEAIDKGFPASTQLAIDKWPADDSRRLNVDEVGTSSTSRPRSDRVTTPEQEAAFTSTIHESGRAYWNSVARIGVQVAEALQYAASQGVLHRDIKPANLLLDLKGNVWITDFGLAKSDDSDELTNPGDIIGTLRYLPPERLRGECDLRSDLYSLGVTLYELLALRPIFEGVHREQLLTIIADVDPVRPRLIDSSIPADLETVVLKAMAKDPLDRYASGTDLAEDLQRFLDDRPIRARRLRPMEQLWRWCRRNPQLASLLSITAVLTLTLVVGLRIASAIRVERDSAVSSRERARQAEREAQQQQLRAESAEREARIRSHLFNATALQRTGQEGQRFASLDLIRAAAELEPTDALKEELRHAVVSAIGLTDVRPIVERSTDVFGPGCFDHRGQRYAQVNVLGNQKPQTAIVTESPTPIPGDGTLIVRSVDNWTDVTTWPAPGISFWYAIPEYSPDDRFLSVMYLGRGNSDLLQCRDAKTGEVVMSVPAKGSDFASVVAWHPNGSEIVFPASSAELCVYDLDQRREVRRIPTAFPVSDVCFDPTGTRLALCEGGRPDVVMLDSATGEELERLKRPDANPESSIILDWSTDGELIAACRVNGAIDVWHLPTQRLASVLHGHTGLVIRCAFQPGSHLLATRSWDGSSRLWNAATGESLLTSDRVFADFAGDRMIGYQSSVGLGVGLCELTHDRELRRLHDTSSGNLSAAHNGGGITWATFSLDERLLVIHGSQFIDFWDIATARRLQRVTIGDTCQRVLFHPDGTQMVTLSREGLKIWPLQVTDAGDGQTVNCGPPEDMAALSVLGSGLTDVCWINGGQRLAVFDTNRSRVVILDRQARATNSVLPDELPAMHSEVSLLAVSPDGHWLAGGGYREPAIQIWNLQTRDCITIPVDDETALPSCSATFNSDGRWMIASLSAEFRSGGHRVYETATWRQLRETVTSHSPGRAVFARHPNYFASMSAPHEVAIQDIETGHEFMRMRIPGARWSPPLAFIQNDSVLAMVTGKDTADVLLWDLKSTAELLQDIGLPLDRSLQLGEPIMTDVKPLRLILDEGTLPQQVASEKQRQLAATRETEARRLIDAGRFDAAAVEFQEALRVTPDDPRLANNFAWMLVTRPDHNPEHAAQSLTLATQAVERQPNEASYWNTLGVARYRAEKFAEAIASLEKAESLSPRTWFTSNAYFIAMAHWKLSHHEDARRWFADAEAVHELRSADDAEVAGFRAEAARLLGVE